MNENIVVFGKGRSGTNAYAEHLSITKFPDHVYLKEFFSTKWIMNESGVVVTSDNCSEEYLDQDFKIQQVRTKVIPNGPFLLNCTPYGMTQTLLDFLISTSKIYVITRDNIIDQFLSHVLAWFNDDFYSNQVDFARDSIYINEQMFNQYWEYHKKYNWVYKQFSPSNIVRFEDIQFSTKTYHSWYSMPRLDYILNKDEVLEFCEKLKTQID